MKTPRVLIVGAGSIGERHLRCFQRTGRCSLNICDRNGQLLEAVAGRYGIVDAQINFETAVGMGFDAVVICTPAHLHIPMAREAVRHAKHVLIEKPLSTGLEGVFELRQEAHDRGVGISVAYVLRANPVLAEFRAALQSGKFGRPVEVIGIAGQHFPHYRPAYREIYYRDRATGGGAVQDALTHVVNAIEWTVGPAEKVVADLDHQVLEGVSVEDTVHVLTRHSGGVMGSIQLNQFQVPFETSITVNCTGGTARVELHKNRWRWMEKPESAWTVEPGRPMERDDLFMFQANAFLDSIEFGKAPLCALEEGVQTLQMNLAILESAASGAWVRLPEVV